MRKDFRRFLFQFREYILLVVLLLISLLCISLNDKPQVKKVRVLGLESFATFTSVLNDLSNFFTDNTELNNLRKQNAELMLQVNFFRKYGLENNELKNLLKFKSHTNQKLTSASIISRLISKSQGNIIINVGKKDSIKVGMPVINMSGLVGIITDVSDNFAIVRTLENTNIKIAVTDQRSNISGILQWNGNDFIIKNIPTTDDIEQGDRIVISEFSTILPPSIPIGVVSKKEINISGLLGDVFVQPFVDFNSIKNVFVMNVAANTEIDSLKLNLFKKE